jgi:anti-sigma regulatory factor (Ser/Thr protein kinase)
MTVVPLEHSPPMNSIVWPLAAQIVLNTLPDSPARGRAFVAGTLARWDMAHLAGDAEYVTSELVTNAVRASWPLHATVMLCLRADGTDLIIEVEDQAPGVPRTVAAPGENGRGLAIVAGLSQRWGFCQDRHGKAVWAYLAGD